MEKQFLRKRLMRLGLVAVSTYCLSVNLQADDVLQALKLQDFDNEEFSDWKIDLEAPKDQGDFYVHTLEIPQQAEQAPSLDTLPDLAPNEEVAALDPHAEEALLRLNEIIQTNLIAQETPQPSAPSEVLPDVAPKPGEAPAKTILINFNNVSIIEFIRFVSRISNKNFVFDDNDLQFNVTIVSEEPTTIENVMTALLQVLRIHDLLLLEQGNNLVIHKNQKVNNISRVQVEDQPPSNTNATEITTQVYRLNTIDPDRARDIIKPLVSAWSIVEVLKNPNTLVVTDLVANIREITQLLRNIDSPKSGMVIGQYVVRNAFIDTLIQLAQKIMQPIAGEQSIIFVPHTGANSIFIISTPYLVERTISILQYLDQFQGSTRILKPQEMRFEGRTAVGGTGATGGTGAAGAVIPGRWERDAAGNWIYTPNLPAGTTTDPTRPPNGRWLIDENGNWYFQPGTGAEAGGLQGPGGQPEGQWVLNPQGIWVFQLAPGKSIAAERLSRQAQAAQDLPVGHIERTQFFIHKLKYRKGNQIEKALGRIAESLVHSGSSNNDLLTAIYSANWIESSNALIFSGTPAAIERLRELIDQLDLPLRQVFVEMLILETTLAEQLALGVDFGSRFGGGQGGGLVAGSQAFLNRASVLPLGLDTAGLVGTTVSGVTPVASGINPIAIADASQLARISGQYTLGLIGQSLHHHGTTFNTIGALITALHNNTKVDVVLNPKLLAEDGSTAEIFVGINTAFPVQSITNAAGATIAQNFEYRDVGTRLKITPIISNDDMVTIEIEEEVSNVSNPATTSGNTNQLIGPTTRKSRSTMRAHIPNKYFLVVSGMTRNTDRRTRNNVPCLGGVPLIGAAFSTKGNLNDKRNIMIFVRPEIIDTEYQIDDLTKRQQNIWRVKNKPKKDWIREDQETLDWLNLKNTDWNDPDDSSLE
jgi:type III secretion protein C